MPDLQPLPADEPFIQFNISTATDRKRQVVSFPIPQNYLSLGSMLNQVHVPHSKPQRPTKRFYITSSHAPRRLQLPSREYLAFSAPPVSPESPTVHDYHRELVTDKLWCGTKVSVVRCHRSLTTSLSRTIRCTILFNRCPHLAAFRSLCQTGYFAKYSVTSKIISNKIYRSLYDLCDTSSH